MAKANPLAAPGSEMASFPDDAMLFDGTELTAQSGGVVLADGEYYSLSRPELAVDGDKTAQKGEILVRRTGRITLLDHKVSQPTTYGGEFECATLDPDTGDYSDRFGFDGELYNYMVETGTRVADSTEDMGKAYQEMSEELVGTAEDRGVRLTPVSVFGQREARPDEASTNPYVVRTVENMDRITGFSAAEIFRVAGWQPHTRISNTAAAAQAAEAMQLLSPILMAPSLAGPHLEGGRAANFLQTPLTEQQLEHMRAAGIQSRDLLGDYLSHRYWLRRVGSPSAGVWTRTAPESVEEYLGDAHKQLANGEINNIDRFRGWHTDRLRSVLDGSDATTFEGCSYDTFAGNVQALTDNHVLHSALFTALEKKAMQGEDVAELVAKELGVDYLSKEGRLFLAHRMALEISRYGTNTDAYGKTPSTWLRNSLLPLAEQAPHTQLDIDRRLRLLGNFATMEETLPALRRWCTDHKSDPTVQAYYDLGLNNPAVYMRAQREAMPGNVRGSEAVRKIELDMANAYHSYVGRLVLV